MRVVISQEQGCLRKLGLKPQANEESEGSWRQISELRNTNCIRGQSRMDKYPDEYKILLIKA